MRTDSHTDKHDEATGRFSQICEKRPVASSCLSVCLSVRMEQLVSHWTDFYKIRLFGIIRKCVENIQLH